MMIFTVMRRSFCRLRNRPASLWKRSLLLTVVVGCMYTTMWWTLMRPSHHGHPVWRSLMRQTNGQATWSSNNQTPASAKSPTGWPDKWIIADGRAGNCERGLQAPPGWKVMYVGEETADTTRRERSKTDHKHALETFLFNSSLLQDADKESVHVWRKNAAFLTAMAHGAVTIVETDCSVAGTEVMKRLERAGPRAQGLMYNDTLLFNPYAHLGAWALAPRAALHTGLWNNSRLYYVRDFNTVLVKHAVSHRSADAVVVIHTDDGRGQSVGRRFDPSSPPVYVGQRSLAPVVPDCSLYHRQAFWALLDPCLSSSLHCRVLRTFLQQRLLRELDAFTGYYQITSSRFHGNVSLSNWTAYSAGGTDETYSADGINLMEAATYLNTWKCADKLSFYTCFKNLVQDLGAKGYVKQAEKAMITSWIAALEKLGVEEAVRVKSPWRGVRKVSEVRVTFGSVQTRLEYGGSDEEKQVSELLVDPVLNCCRQHPNSSAPVFPIVSSWKTPVIEDLVLIIVFNWDNYFWPALPFLETMHRPFFKHLVYCVPDVDKLVREDDHGALQHVTLLEGLSDSWYLFYGCVTQVMEMHLPGVQGYVQIGDDVLLNTWRMLNGSRDVMLVHECGQLRPIDDYRWYWFHWSKPRGRCTVLRTLAGLEKISGLDKQQLLTQDVSSNGSLHRTFTDVLQADQRGNHSTQWCPLLPGTQDWQDPTKEQARRFLRNYYHVNKMAGKIRHNGQDFTYFPQTSAADYIPLSRYFMKNRVMVELAVYNIQLGLSGPERRKTVAGTNSIGKGRNRWDSVPETRYDPSHHYLHPFKLSRLYTDKHLIGFFCDVHLKNLFTELVKGGRKN